MRHTFFVHFFAVVLHSDNVKLPETSELHVLCRKRCMWSCSLFFSMPLIFTFVAASISHFLTAGIKFSCYSSNEIGCSFSVIHANVDIKIRSKERIGLLLLFFISKSLGSYAMYRLNPFKFHPGLHGGVDVRTDVLRTDDFLRTRISRMHRLPNFLIHGAPLRALRARELRYYFILFSGWS